MRASRVARGARRCAVGWLLLLLMLFLGPACGDPGLSADPVGRVLVIGVDGLEWSVLHPLLRSGRLPNLADLMQRGSYGRLGTLLPTQSPVIWTSAVTGKAREQHGILGFLDQEGRAYTSSRRQGRALWNIADRYGLTCNVFGWWITWPVEEIAGVMVSATGAGKLAAGNRKGALVPGVAHQVHPPGLDDEVMAIAGQAGSDARVKQLGEEKVFGIGLGGDLPEVERKLITQTLWSIASDETYFQVAAAIMPAHPADLNMVYFAGPDVVGHRFWRHYRPWEFAYRGESADADAALMCTIPNTYAWVDEMIGELVVAAGEGATVIVLSDHGMHAAQTDEPGIHHTTADHADGPPGVLVAAGPGIERQGGFDDFLRTGELPVHGSVYTVAPTVLGLLGIPAARDMEDRACRAILTPETWDRIQSLDVVDTHDDGFRETQLVELPPHNRIAFVDRMAALGYVMVADDDTATELVDPARYGTVVSLDDHPCH